MNPTQTLVNVTAAATKSAAIEIVEAELKSLNTLYAGAKRLARKKELICAINSCELIIIALKERLD